MNYKGIKDKKYICLNCGLDIPFKGYSYHYKYCNNKCQGEFKSKEQTTKNIELFKKGKLSDRSRNQIKRTMLAMGIENKCSICGITEWCKKQLPFILDHIDGNAENNNPNNLRLICSNCDSQSDYYKGKNKGRGKRKYYNQTV